MHAEKGNIVMMNASLCKMAVAYCRAISSVAMKSHLSITKCKMRTKYATICYIITLCLEI